MPGNKNLKPHEEQKMTEQTPLKTNHNIRIVTLTTAERVLCMFGEVRGDDEKVVGYRMFIHTL
jgi:hypothetical protein